jgi:hypothetical protein
MSYLFEQITPMNHPLSANRKLQKSRFCNNEVIIKTVADYAYFIGKGMGYMNISNRNEDGFCLHTHTYDAITECLYNDVPF